MTDACELLRCKAGLKFKSLIVQYEQLFELLTLAS